MPYLTKTLTNNNNINQNEKTLRSNE